MLFGFWTRVGRMKRRRYGLMSNYFDHLLLLIARPCKQCACAKEGRRRQHADARNDRTVLERPLACNGRKLHAENDNLYSLE